MLFGYNFCLYLKKKLTLFISCKKYNAHIWPLKCQEIRDYLLENDEKGPYLCVNQHKNSI